jgi:hypothetical protein
MAAEKLDILIEQGATFKWYITVLDPESTASPQAPLDLTTYSVRGMGRTAYTAAAASFTFACTIQDQVTNTGEVLLYLTDETTAALAKGNYVYDVELESVGGEVARLYQGRATVSPEATKV